MAEGIRGTFRIRYGLAALACAAFFMHSADAGAAKKKKKPSPAKKAQSATLPPSAPKAFSPPPEADLRARVEWATKEADGMRKSLALSPRDEGLRTSLGALAVIVASDLERALSVGDIANATALRKLVEQKLADTRWRLGLLGRQGSGGGYFALGVMSLHGILGERDPDIACTMFASAWDKHYSDAAYRLSDCVAKADPARASSLLTTAAESGHALASELVGRRCLEASPPDTQCAFTRVSAAAAAGRASAKSLLGWMYAQGAGTGADPKRALSLYLEAADAGDLSALNNLGELYETGRAVAPDPARAVEYYTKASEGGLPAAQFNLGRMYAAGNGIDRDHAKARLWLSAALKGGVQPAQKILDWMDSAEAQKR